ncbi:MAG: L-aspartate oxidase, partial [Bdellovibrionales bacterium]|nr:L-aspartate oxidase [Bdellovibrionales bacterium]
MKDDHFQYLVIGSGLAGLAFALKAASQGRVLVLSKTGLESSNTEMAQGGIAAVMSTDDDLDKHVQDTLIAGAGLCKEEIVRACVEQGPSRIRDLVDWGVKFDLNENQQFSLTREGGHSQRRILHIEDHTGLEIHRQLLKKVKENPNITLRENHFAIELISLKKVKPQYFGLDRCVGAYVLDKKSQEVYAQTSDFTILATGGAGKVYLYTSNWSGATGDGIAMAHQIGARVANMEFMQFHPTCLYHPDSRNFLITEALRGEGGELINHKGEAFMKTHHPLGSLAPRDIVARSIDAEMKKSGADSVFLDITHKPAEFIRTRFPHIYKRCLELGIDITKKPIPVVPAAHYLCGGVMTDVHGRTDIAGLYAVGETACTGLHGANRLASNSLLECLVFSHNAALDIREHQLNVPTDLSDLKIPAWPKRNRQNEDELILVSHMWDEIRRLMWAYVGI